MSDWQADLAAREAEWGANHPVSVDFRRWRFWRSVACVVKIGTAIVGFIGFGWLFLVLAGVE